jgi:hypothetical protein
MSSLQQNPNSSYFVPESPIESLDGKNNTNMSSSEINELKNLVVKNNENGEEISGCFDRASIPDATLSKSEIIQCAEDHESFSNENNVNADVDNEGKTDGRDDGNDNDGRDDGNDNDGRDDGNDNDGRDDGNDNDGRDDGNDNDGRDE